eukprot:738085-Prymnesium_polylepis.1
MHRPLPAGGTCRIPRYGRSSWARVEASQQGGVLAPRARQTCANLRAGRHRGRPSTRCTRSRCSAAARTRSRAPHPREISPTERGHTKA